MIYEQNKINIVGNGLIASGLKRVKGIKEMPVLFFAAGVSNSQCTDRNEFQREEELLSSYTIKLANNNRLVYFSTCSVKESESSTHDTYISHKQRMEKLVEERGNYTIFRLTQIAGHSSNPHTLLNYLRNRLTNRQPITIQKRATRNIIDIEDAVDACLFFINSPNSVNKIIDIGSLKSHSVQLIAEQLAEVLHTKAILILDDTGSKINVDISDMKSFCEHKKIRFDENYLIRTLKKYYSLKL